MNYIRRKRELLLEVSCNIEPVRTRKMTFNPN